MKKNPAQIAQDLAKQFPNSMHFEKVNAVGPYLNFFVNRVLFAQDVLKQASRADFGKASLKQKIIIDYSHPNVAKHFGVHNLRSTFIGHALYNILGFAGNKVISVNHLGDWGTQFGKLLVAYKKYGKPQKLKNIEYLNALYVKFHEDVEKDHSLEEEARAEFRKLEEGDKKNLLLWKKMRAFG